MIGTIYSIDIPSTAVTTAVDLVEITPADDRPISIVGIHLFQTTDVGDAAEEVLALQIIRGFTTSGNGTAATPRPMRRNASAAGCAAETIATTLANTGTTHTLLSDGWNVRIPYLWQPIAEEYCPQASQADTTMVVRLSAPADSVTVQGCVWILESA